MVVASLRAVDHRCCTPLPVKLPVVMEKVVKVEKVVVVNPWPRGWHTQIAVIGAFSFQKPAASNLVVSFLDIEPH